MHEGIVSMWPMSRSVAGMGTIGSANSMKVMELSPKGVGLLSEWLEILGEQFQHGNPIMVEAKTRMRLSQNLGKNC